MGALFTFLDFLLVALGFGLIIFVHELGHFLAARWAGIRVMAFAIGMGPAVASYRKGMGLTAGSSEPEYLARLAAKGATLDAPPSVLPGVSPTEYRFNILPFGGYVKMLGQVDGDASATSGAPDGYQRCKPWKRMVVISAGVIANLITAAALFILVFMLGLRTDPPVVGNVAPNSPAARAEVTTADGTPIEGGLRPGDILLTIDHEEVRHFPDASTFIAMAARDTPVRIGLERDGRVLTAMATPEVGEVGLLQIGIEPGRSATIFAATSPKEDATIREELAKAGLAALGPGWNLTAIDGVPTSPWFFSLAQAAMRSEGRPMRLTFAPPGGGEAVDVTLSPKPRLEVGNVPRDKGQATQMEHLLGLTPVMKITDASPEEGPKASEQGFETGDVFARIGGVEFPNIEQGIREIAANKGRTIPVSVLRRDASGAWREVDLGPIRVNNQGRIGFGIGDTAEDSTLLSRPPARIRPVGPAGAPEYTPAAARLVHTPGQEIVSINGEPTPNLFAVREAIRRAAITSSGDGTTPISVVLRRAEFRDGATPPAESTVDWSLTPEERRAVAALGWDSPVPAGLFAPPEFVLKRSTIGGALTTGLAETRRVMLSTYLTFKRLTVDRTVKVEHLKGPVGIAHIGTAFASRGIIWLLFFLALISVNLAVINFLPLPIVDGGQFLFLVYEQVRGRPAPIIVQNVLTVAGLILIAGIFLVVTFNDVKNLLGL